MTGSALFDFFIAIVGLCLIVWLFYIAVDKLAPDDFFKKVARAAVGGVALLAFLFAIKGVLFGGGGAIALISLLVVAGQVLFGGGMDFGRLGVRHGALQIERSVA